jgi:RHH-type transcriptional regulator, rel operon repressor / antitoxin RelB
MHTDNKTTRSEMMTVRLAPGIVDKLEALARNTNRSKSYLANEAIENYVHLNAWQVAHIKAALAEDEQGGPSVPNEEVMEWLSSWGTDNELPCPEPK